VHTRTQLLTLLSCTYISLTEIAKNFVGAKDAMPVRVDGGAYHKAFVVLDTKQFNTQGDFQKALTGCLDTIRRRLTMGDCADDAVCRDLITRNPHNAYDAPLPVSLPERMVVGSDLSDEGQTAGCDSRLHQLQPRDRSQDPSFF
jgi:hypothetical protein